MKLLFVSTNQHKKDEIKRMLPQGWMLQGMHDLGLQADIEETADTIAGNSRIKAEEGFARAGIPCFAEDSGLEVDALNGTPGVRSARYAEGGSAANMSKLLLEMQWETQRQAQFITVITFTDGKEFYQFTGICKGEISTHILGDNGFGYDPIFIPAGASLSFGQMDEMGKAQYSHRKKAFDQLLAFLQDKFGADGRLA